MNRDDYRAELFAEYRSTHFEEVAAQEPSATLAKQVLPHLPNDRSARVMDVGCGSGELLRLLEARGYSAVVGIDVSSQQVERARELGTANAFQADLFDYLGQAERPYDAIAAIDVLEHLGKAEILRGLHAIRAALQPGGRLVIRVPNAQSPFGGRFRYGDFTHETSFTQHSIAQVLRATGFTSIETLPAELAVHGVVSAARRALWTVLAGGIKLSLAIETGIVRGHIVTQNLVAVAYVPVDR